MSITLLSIRPSHDQKHKYFAEFLISSKGRKTQTHIVHFGAKGYQDFTIHKDPIRKQRYLERHFSRENWKDPTSPGALSRWILWNKPTFRASVDDFRKRFHL